MSQEVRKTFDYMVSQLRNLDDRGSIVAQDGALLIRKDAPRKDGLFAQAYLHELYAPLSANEVSELSKLIGQGVPADLAKFYQCANGLSLFSASFIIKGLRKNYDRNSDMRLPVSIEYGNTIERPYEGKLLDDGRICFGFYSDGNGFDVSVMLDNHGGLVLTPRFQLGPVLHRWSDMSEFLRHEVDRLIVEYKKRDGRVDMLNVLSPPLPD